MYVWRTGLVLDRAGRYEVRGSGSVIVPPDGRKIACLQPVLTGIVVRGGAEESDLVEVDVADRAAGLQVLQVQLEADR